MYLLLSEQNQFGSSNHGISFIKKSQTKIWKNKAQDSLETKSAKDAQSIPWGTTISTMLCNAQQCSVMFKQISLKGFTKDYVAQVLGWPSWS